MTRLWLASRSIMVLGLAWPTLIGMAGCSRQLAAPGSDPKANTGQLPFDRVSDNSGISPTAGLPFEGIPVGMEFTIRLQLALSSADSRAGDSFQAALDDPVVVAGKTVLPRGAQVTGSVVAAKASGGPHDPGYLRVTLASIAIRGKSIPVETSSIFAKGRWYEKRSTAMMKRSAVDTPGSAAKSAMDSPSGSEPSVNPARSDVRFSTGHRLSFRLAQPLPL